MGKINLCAALFLWRDVSRITTGFLEKIDSCSQARLLSTIIRFQQDSCYVKLHLLLGK